MKCANKIINCERHTSLTNDDLMCDLNKATILTKSDLQKSHHQIPLAPESRYVTTFATHEGSMLDKILEGTQLVRVFRTSSVNRYMTYLEQPTLVMVSL